jgi:hypothetical protein
VFASLAASLRAEISQKDKILRHSGFTYELLALPAHAKRPKHTESEQLVLCEL